MTSFQLKATFPVPPLTLYSAWLNSEEHTKMTGGEAQCSNKEGGGFTAWDGYISGKNVRLVPDKEIHQRWRTAEFDESDEDSVLQISFRETAAGCEVTLNHSHIPEGQPDYERGWTVHYFDPMTNYFNSGS